MAYKTPKRIKLVKVLTSTSWSADENKPQVTVFGYVRSAIDNCLYLQAVASEHILAPLDTLRVQIQRLRFTRERMRTTATAFSEIYAKMEPLDIKKRRAVLEAIKRYKKIETHDPNRQTIDRWKFNQRIQQKLSLEAAKNVKSNVTYT